MRDNSNITERGTYHQAPILAFDTSSSACSVALQTHHHIESIHTHAPMQHGKLILSMIQTLLQKTKLTIAQLNAVAYGVGPGRFTGVRLASSVAQSIQLGTKCRLIAISSLVIYAQTVFIEHPSYTKICVALDARMGQVYWGQYEVNQQGYVVLIGQEQTATPEEIMVAITIADCGVGDGWEVYKERLISRIGFTPQHLLPAQLPNAKAILKLAEINNNHSRL